MWANQDASMHHRVERLDTAFRPGGVYHHMAINMVTDTALSPQMVRHALMPEEGLPPLEYYDLLGVADLGDRRRTLLATQLWSHQQEILDLAKLIGNRRTETFTQRQIDVINPYLAVLVRKRGEGREAISREAILRRLGSLVDIPLTVPTFSGGNRPIPARFPGGFTNDEYEMLRNLTPDYPPNGDTDEHQADVSIGHQIGHYTEDKMAISGIGNFSWQYRQVDRQKSLPGERGRVLIEPDRPVAENGLLTALEGVEAWNLRTREDDSKEGLEGLQLIIATGGHMMLRDTVSVANWVKSRGIELGGPTVVIGDYNGFNTRYLAGTKHQQYIISPRLGPMDYLIQDVLSHRSARP